MKIYEGKYIYIIFIYLKTISTENLKIICGFGGAELGRDHGQK